MRPGEWLSMSTGTLTGGFTTMDCLDYSRMP